MKEANWLADIPKSWEVKNLRFLGEVILGLTYSPADVCDGSDGVLVIRASNIQDGKLVHADDVFVSTDIPEKIVTRPGDIVICSRNGSRRLIGKSAVVTGEWVGQTFGAFMTTVRSQYPEWMSWILSSSLFTFQSGRYMTSTINQLTINALKSFAVPLPPLETQKRIAAFLDEKTAQIDGLIARKQALLARLAEKRQAIITQAVTKGLNPAAPLKESGSDWLGQIPAHWEAVPLKRLKRFLTSGSRGWGDYYADEGDVFLRMTNVTKGGVEIDTTDLRHVKLDGVREGTRTATKVGDILITITAELGSVAIVRAALAGAFINQHIALFRPDQSQCDPDFLVNFLWSDVTKVQFELSGQGGTKQGLGFDQVDNVMIALPPLDEQREIARQVESSRNDIDVAEGLVSQSVTALTEYRSALITSAVTGQIEGLR